MKASVKTKAGHSPKCGGSSCALAEDACARHSPATSEKRIPINSWEQWDNDGTHISRFYNQKARKIKNFIDYLLAKHGGSLNVMISEDLEVLREQLLSIKGIGKETADSILLYAGNKLSFVSDAYTKRFVTRFGLLSGEPNYDEIRAYFSKRIPPDVALYHEFHALIVYHGYATCKTTPDCNSSSLHQPQIHLKDCILSPFQAKVFSNH